MISSSAENYTVLGEACMCRVTHGKMIFTFCSKKYSRGIYSHDTALYLLSYSDRTQARYTMTFPKGYNAPSLKQEDLIVKRVIPKNYNFGIIKIQSPSGNPICVYDLERTLCDILRGSGSDIIEKEQSL